MASRIQLLHDTEENWTANGSKILRDGEIAVVHCSDGSTKLKAGDGTSTFSQLNYVNENNVTFRDWE